MQRAIGKIVLSKKMFGWVDHVNMIRLTAKNPEAVIYEGYNLTLINKAVKEGKIEFIKFEW